MFHVLSSGSSGNCYCVETSKSYIFVDIGISKKSVEAFLNTMRRDKQVYLLVTHEHSDHIKGIKPFINILSPRVYASPGTAEALSSLGVSTKSIFPVKPSSYCDLGDFAFDGFKISHDAVDPMGFMIMTDNGNIGIATDLGYITDDHINILKQADLVVLEANYDEELLKKGKYPAYLKRRIRSKKGHLSNTESFKALSALSNSAVKKCLLAHVSEENNDYDMLDRYAAFYSDSFNISTSTLRQKRQYSFEISKYVCI